MEISKKLKNHQNQNEALLKQIAERKRLLHQDVAEFKDRDRKQIQTRNAILMEKSQVKTW